MLWLCKECRFKTWIWIFNIKGLFIKCYDYVKNVDLRHEYEYLHVELGIPINGLEYRNNGEWFSFKLINYFYFNFFIYLYLDETK
jgi:hypothetical protein